MLVQASDSGARSRPPSRPSAILDSPILARVERVLLRQDEGYKRDSLHSTRAAYTQSLLSSNFGKESPPAIKRGLLWQQRDKLFSRWKERYFILTSDYLHCFRRASGADRISEMGQFLFKVKLADLERVGWENKRTYSTVSLVAPRDGKMYLRAPDGLEDWFELIEECTITSKERRRAFRRSHDVKLKDNNNVNMMGMWLASHSRLPARQLDEGVRRRDRTTSPSSAGEWERHPGLDNRLSRKLYAPKFFYTPSPVVSRKMLTDIDINSYDDSTLGAPSITSYRLNEDVLCIQPPSLRGMGSFRSTREASTPTKRPVPNVHDVEFIKFRERSYSDIQREDRRLWRGLTGDSRKFQ